MPAVARLQQLLLGHLDDLVYVHARRYEPRVAHELLHAPQVGADRLGHTRVLHLDRDVPAVAQHGAVHLPNRRRRDRRVFEGGELLPPRLAQLGAQRALQRVGLGLGLVTGLGRRLELGL